MRRTNQRRGSALLARVVLLAALVAAAGAASASDNNYHPPVLEPLPVSSSFGEFRANHFHGGIDFSTSGRIGIPVHAVADGWVWRVRASGSGYGLALYLRLSDGRTQVVAHLDRVATEITGFIAAAQESLDRYEVDLHPPPGRLPVRRGEVIAWTGESGAGPAHLHFEMREGEDAGIGVNPRLLGFGDRDVAVPVIRRVLVVPVGAGSRVNGSPTMKSFTATPIADGRYRLPGSIDVTGNVRFGLDVVDPAPRDNLMAPYRVQIVEGDIRHYDVRLDRVDWTRTHEVECFFDLAEADHGRRFVLNCQRWPGVRDPVFGSLPIGAGVLEPPPAPGPGTRRVTLRAFDLAGHEAAVDVDLLQRPVESPRLTTTRATSSTPAIDLGAAVTVAGLTVRQRVRQDWRDPRVTVAPPLMNPLSWFDRLIGRAPPPAASPTALWPMGGGDSSALLSPPSTFEFRPRLELAITDPDGSPRTIGVDTLDIIGLVRGEGRTVRFGILSLAFPDSAAFMPFWLGLSTAPGDTGNGLVPVSKVYHLEAPGIVLDRPARFAIAPDGTPTHGLGLYRRSGGGWSWVGNEAGPDGVGGNTRYLGELMLARDARPPVVTLLAPAARVREPRPTIRVSIKEAGSGLIWPLISATLDGVTQLLVWDPESRTLSGRSRRPLARGAHRLVVTAVDRAGNSTTATREFQVVH